MEKLDVVNYIAHLEFMSEDYRIQNEDNIARIERLEARLREQTENFEHERKMNMGLWACIAVVALLGVLI